MLSKRKLLQLVGEGTSSGWDDPRMPTISGLRRRGYTPEAIRAFCERIGVAKLDSLVDVDAARGRDARRPEPRARRARWPCCARCGSSSRTIPRARSRSCEAVNNPEDPSTGTREVPFSRVLYIEQDDFREDPPKKFFRLAPGSEVRLRYAYFVTCVGVVKDDATGEVVELRCTYDPATRGGDAARRPQGEGDDPLGLGRARRRRRGAALRGAVHARGPRRRGPEGRRSRRPPLRGPATTRTRTMPPLRATRDWRDDLNPRSLEVLQGCKIEPALAGAAPGSRWQFERQAYFCADAKDHRPGAPVFNRTVGLRDTWGKIQKKQGE